MPIEVSEDIFRIEVPLPGNPLKAVNAYAVKGNGRNLLIDTGLNRTECEVALREGLNEIGIDLKKTDFFITHVHADHLALLSRVAEKGCRVFFNRPDAAILEDKDLWEKMIRYAGRNGFPEDKLRDALQSHPGYRHGPGAIPEFTPLGDGDILEAGGYRFRCIETPGHTPGHLCLYEPGKKLLISGDHLLVDITPNIQCWKDGIDPLRSYLQSLDRIYGLDVEQVLPGHRRVFGDHQGRIRELKRHHRKRAEEVLEILWKQPCATAFEVASRMTWEIRCESWDLFPIPQKWFATGEAISHLRYLENRALAAREPDGPTIRFTGAAGRPDASITEAICGGCVRIVRAASPADMEEVRRLFREYNRFLDVDLCFQSFEEELAKLPGKYAPPEGSLLLAFYREKPAGCVGLRKLEEGVCEMKRLFVRPEHKGRGLGRLLAERIVSEAVSLGYTVMRLDTLGRLKEAIKLYESIGFERRSPYCLNPIADAAFFEMRLTGRTNR